MDFYLNVTNYVGSLSTVVNGLFLLLILMSPPDNLGIFRSQYYFGAATSFLFAATHLWSADIFYPNGTMLLVFSARRAGPIGFMAFLAAHDLQFAILAANFAARYAAIRGGWLHHLFTNKLLFYSALLTSTLFFVPLTVLMDPIDELRTIANSTYGRTLKADFMEDYFFVCSYDRPYLGSQLVQRSIFMMPGVAQLINLIVMLVCGMATYLHISTHTRSVKLKEVNKRLLFARGFQAGFSFLFLFLPALLINMSMLIEIDASSIAPHLNALMSLGTLFNPFVDITLTTDYRTRIVRLLISHDSISRSIGEYSVSTGVRIASSRSVIVRVR